MDSESPEQPGALEDGQGVPEMERAPVTSPTNPAYDSVMEAESGPPVGLSWRRLAGNLGLDEGALRHDGVIVVAGEYFPASGYFFDPASLVARRVDVGDIALRHGYFVAAITLRRFKVDLSTEEPRERRLTPIIPKTRRGPVIGLFAGDKQAQQAKDRILRAALGSAIGVEAGPLGTEVRVGRPQQPGRVASVLASHGGAVIAIDGRAVGGSLPPTGAAATGLGDEPGDAPRAGTGVIGDSRGPEVSDASEAQGGTNQVYRRVSDGRST